MTAIVGTDTFTATCVGPDPGTATHTQVNDLGTHLANRTIWLKERIAGRIVLADRVKTNATVTDAPSDLFDAKAVTTWTTVGTVTATSGIVLVPGDIMECNAVVHVRSSRAGAGYLGLRLKLTYSISGVPADAVIFTRRWVGHSAAHIIFAQPVDLFVTAAAVANADSPVVATLQIMNTTAPDPSDDVFIMNPWEVNLEIHRPIPVP